MEFNSSFVTGMNALPMGTIPPSNLNLFSICFFIVGPHLLIPQFPRPTHVMYTTVQVTWHKLHGIATSMVRRKTLFSEPVSGRCWVSQALLPSNYFVDQAHVVGVVAVQPRDVQRVAPLPLREIWIAVAEGNSGPWLKPQG